MEDDQKLYDPTRNVIALVASNSERLQAMLDIHIKRLDERFATHVEYAANISLAENSRISAIREMDVKTYETAMNQATEDRLVLSNRMTVINDGLRALISASQEVLTKQTEQRVEQLSDRITLLERAQYQTQGKDQTSRSVIATLAAIMGAIAAMLFQHFVLGK